MTDAIDIASRRICQAQRQVFLLRHRIDHFSRDLPCRIDRQDGTKGTVKKRCFILPNIVDFSESLCPTALQIGLATLEYIAFDTHSNHTTFPVSIS